VLAWFSTDFGSTVTIDDGSGGGSTNNPPTASFNYSCTGLTCNFVSTASDIGGSIQSYSWNFGDSSTASVANPSHTYAAGGTYAVTLTVTDNGGATDSDSQNVTVSASTGGITLSVVGSKVKGLQKADLSWSLSGTSADVDVWRDGAFLTTTPNDGAYTDNINKKGGGSYTYQVCEAGTFTCSNAVTVTF
jgi:PKD repeat protein